MADSIREKIIKKVVTEVADILKSNDYQTNIGQNVFRAYRPGNSSPSIVITPQPETVTRTAYRMDQHRFPLRFEGIDLFNESIAGQGASAVGEKIYPDIVKCVFGITWTAGTDPTIEQTIWDEGGIGEYPAPRDEYVGAYAVIHYIFDTNIGDPFTQ